MNTSFGTRVAGILILTATSVLAGWGPGTTLPELAQFKLDGVIPPLSGKVLLVDFWASWCGPCKASFPSLDKLQKEYGDRGFFILAINQDKTGEAMKMFLTGHPVTFTSLQDTENKLVKDADVVSMPSSYLVDRSGKIRYVHRGFHGEKTLTQYRQEIEILLNDKAGGTK